ncbi:WD40-repeat-containing domain protein [Lentinula raphanica]|nr:WD40-repeat-containing domain protein [Lentinula raphanica]
MNISTAYIFASTNRYSAASDVTSEGTVIFGSSNLLGLWDISDGDKGISATLAGHNAMITCVRVIDSQSFVSADDQGQVRIWERKGFTSQACIEKPFWSCHANFSAHKQAISALCVFDDCIVTGSSEATVKLWKLPQDDSVVQSLQTIHLSGRYPLALACTRLPQSDTLVLAIGGTDRKIQLWTRSDTVFVQSAILGGHEDWIRGLSFSFPETDGSLVLASGSQDATIRLWNIEVYKKGVQSPSSEGLGSDDLLDAFEESLGDFGDAEEGGRQISLKRHIFSVKSKQESFLFSVTFDALLVGHEAGITSVSWRPPNSQNSTPTLLSTSTDSSLIFWSPTTMNTNSKDRTSSIWINRERFGDIGGQRLGGFVGGIWRRDGNEALAWGWSGGWRRWRWVSPSLDNDEIWEESGAIGGHRGSVKSVDWSPTGTFLMSTGIDQTTRIHGAIPQQNDLPAIWYELARPQVHGYDLLGTVFLDELKFASIADEKVLRIFDAPRRFVDLTQALHVTRFSENERSRPMGASAIPLNLSNKADEDGKNFSTISRRPYDGELASVTIWPEVEKIFGHGYESITLAISNSRRYIATACKASSPEHAVVRIYDTTTWQSVGEPLAGHSLTVTQIAFSPDDELILTVSRDRSWRLFQKAETEGRYTPQSAESKPHGRIIWDCAWASEGDIFATASRDKTVKIWGRNDENNWSCVSTLKMEESATAVHFNGLDKQQNRYLAVGLENGTVLLYSNSTLDTNWAGKMSILPDFGHVGQINRLRWRPGTGERCKEIASCSEDGTLRILIVQV